MRTFASFEGYVASTTADGVQLHQYAQGVINSKIDSGDLRLRVESDYPWQGRVVITVEAAPAAQTAISVRIPAWAAGATVDGAAAEPGTYAKISRTWTTGDQLVLDLPLTPRVTSPDPRVDAVRGCVAIERGPLVYALEQQDQQDQTAPDDLVIDPAAELAEESRPDLLDGVMVVKAAGKIIDRSTGEQRDAELVGVPYHLWANRGPQPMRVWIPTA
jgi:DUF1680 family protein